MFLITLPQVIMIYHSVLGFKKRGGGRELVWQQYQFDEMSQQTSQVYSWLVEEKGQLAWRRQRKIAQAKLAAEEKCYYLYRAKGCFPPEIDVPSDESGASISRSLCFLLPPPQILWWMFIFAICLRLLKNILDSMLMLVTLGWLWNPRRLESQD